MRIAKTLYPEDSYYGFSAIDTCDVECPYCGARLEVDYDDREGWISGDVYETGAECPVCEREFKLICSISIDYEAEPLESEADDGN